jgi:predicted dehydrogenase
MTAVEGVLVRASRHLRVGVVGTGMIAAVHMRAARRAGARVIGVVASSAARSRQAAEEWGVAEGFDTVDSLLEAGPDVIHICTPNHLHAPMASAALRAGVHVVCEKPLGVTPQDADELATLARSTGLVATVPFVYRFHPMVREIRERRLRGDLGDVLTIHGSYLQDWMLSPTAANWRVSTNEGGASRAFADIGSHWVDLVEWVTGTRFSEVSAATSIAYSERPSGSSHAFATGHVAPAPMMRVQTEDVAAAILRSSEGTIATTTVSQVSAGRKNRLWFEVDGSGGSAVFDQEEPERAWFGNADGAQIVVRDPNRNLGSAARLGTLPAGHAQGYADCFDAFVADTYHAVKADAPEGLPSFDDGARATRIVDAVVQSAASRRWERISDA